MKHSKSCNISFTHPVLDFKTLPILCYLQGNPCAGQRREVHPAARLPLNVPPTLYHGLQNRCEDLPRRGTGQSQGEAQASERHVQQDDQCGPRRPHRGRAQAQRCHETKVQFALNLT